MSVYLVGMGATSPAVASGKGAPRAPLARVAQPATLAVDGQGAEILFQGLVPDQVGLYQVNFRVPTGLRTGESTVSILQNGVEAYTGKLVVGAAQ